MRAAYFPFEELAGHVGGLQLWRATIDHSGVEVRAEANFEMAGLGMTSELLEEDLGGWRTEGTANGVAMAGHAILRLDGEILAAERPFPLRWVWRWRSVAGQVAEFGRLIAVARADMREDDPAPRARQALARNLSLGWRKVLEAHEAAWAARWTAGDVRIEGDDELQRAVRFAVYHLTSAANPDDERVSIGARGLTGDAYFGHVFWDTEIYLLPFYTATWPEAARALLMYRYHTPPGARAKAARFGYKGALYAWESADTGEETTPENILGPDGEPIEVLTGKMEHHISADVAYAVWQYWRATGDEDFLLRAGAEIVLDTARFWASRAVAESDGKWHIRHVIGPDEYHEDVDDNAFTNVMASGGQRDMALSMDSVTVCRIDAPDDAGPPLGSSLGSSMPGYAPLAMPAQSFHRFSRSERRAWVNPGIGLPTALARLVVFGGAVALTAYGAYQMYKVVGVGTTTALEWVMVVLFVITFSWITLSFTASVVGFVWLIAHWRKRQPLPASLSERTAVVMPIYNEAPSRVFGAMQAIIEDVERTRLGSAFDYFFLSDTTDANVWIAEERAFVAMRERLPNARIYYRRRRKNSSRKAGNIADFVTRWGGHYPQMLVLDADSLMSGEAVVRLAAAMEADPDSGIIQSLPLIVNRNTMFARLQQFAARIAGPVIAAGLTAWMGRDGNYWGHNAIIRTRAFADHCGLPDLPGRPPFGGHILSHDFVEAALIRRAGYSVTCCRRSAAPTRRARPR